MIPVCGNPIKVQVSNKKRVAKCRGSRVATKSRGSPVWVVGAGAGAGAGKSRG